MSGTGRRAGVSSLPHRQLRNGVDHATEASRKLAAAQAAQKFQAPHAFIVRELAAAQAAQKEMMGQLIPPQLLAAAQAAQKVRDIACGCRLRLAAAQAAQKEDSKP